MSFPRPMQLTSTEYAQVVKMLGNGRLEAKCQDGETRLGQIRGQMRKKVSHISLRFEDVMTSERLPRAAFLAARPGNSAP